MRMNRVLIISGDRMKSTLLDCALSQEEFRIEQVFDLERARERVSAGEFDIAVVDASQFGFETYELCWKIKRMPGTCLIVLADATSDVAPLLEADYFLSSSLRLDMLLDIFREIGPRKEVKRCSEKIV